MSSSLTWKPVHPVVSIDLSSNLKFALRKGYQNPIDTTMTIKDYGYLRRLRNAGIEEADELIKAIEKYGTIRVQEEF